MAVPLQTLEVPLMSDIKHTNTQITLNYIQSAH